MILLYFLQNIWTNRLLEKNLFDHAIVSQRQEVVFPDYILFCVTFTATVAFCMIGFIKTVFRVKDKHPLRYLNSFNQSSSVCNLNLFYLVLLIFIESFEVLLYQLTMYVYLV